MNGRYLIEALVLMALLSFPASPISVCSAEGEQPQATEKLSESVTRMTYPDGREEWEIAGRGRVKFVPRPPQAREEPTPLPTDGKRGYITFCPSGRRGPGTNIAGGTKKGASQSTTIT